MRSRVSPFSVYLLIAVLCHSLITPAAFAGQDNRTWKQKARDAAASSASSIGVELAVKYVTGFLHDTICDPPSSSDATAVFLCDVVGGLSGRNEEKWKQQVDQKLAEISTKLDTLTAGQDELKRSIGRIETALNYEFDNIAPRTKSFDILSNIDALWTSYTRLIKGKYAKDKNEVLDFANNIVRQNLHAELAKLSVVIEKPIMDAESVLRYPYVKWQKQNPNLHSYNFDPTKVYEVAEKKFMDLRLYQQKGSLMYLFAAEVLEARCEMDKANCVRPPVSSKRFNDDFQQDMKDQLAAFNAALDWFVLSYSEPHYADPGLMFPDGSLNALMRANYLTMTLSGKNGMWGRIYSMGDKWDSAATVKCGSIWSSSFVPQLDYKVPVNDPSGTLDWWTSTAKNGVYDEVHFAKEWRVAHYQHGQDPGLCELQSVVPGRPGIIPWTQKGTEVVEVTGPDGKPVHFGSYLGVQRAGGTYAMVSGDWSGGHSAPFRQDGGDATKKDIRYDWLIDKNHKQGPQISLFHGGRGEWSGGDTKVYHYSIIHMHNSKKIRFPEDRTLKLHLGQSSDCAKVCRNNRGSEHVIMEYDIQNSSGDAGYLHALAGIFLHPDGGDSKAIGYEAVKSHMSNGIFINGSYSNAKDSVTKTFLVEGNQSANVTLDPGKLYTLQYMIDYQLVTYTKGLNAVHFWHRAKITPYAVYLTR
jgi:hypothetical protein